MSSLGPGRVLTKGSTHGGPPPISLCVSHPRPPGPPPHMPGAFVVPSASQVGPAEMCPPKCSRFQNDLPPFVGGRWLSTPEGCNRAGLCVIQEPESTWHCGVDPSTWCRTQRRKGADREGCQEEVRPRLDPRVDGSQMSRTRRVSRSQCRQRQRSRHLTLRTSTAKPPFGPSGSWPSGCACRQPMSLLFPREKRALMARPAPRDGKETRYGGSQF